MTVHFQHFNSTHNFDVTVKSLLLGFTRPENVKTSTCTNVVVFGTTEASATAFVSSLLKLKDCKTVRCAGVDSKPSELAGQGFSGYLIMLPELQYVGNAFFSNFVELYNVLNTANCGKMPDGDYKDLQILFANRQIEAAFFGALFERWKTDVTIHHGWHIDAEEPKYSRALTLGASAFAAKGDFLGYGTDAEYGDADPGLRIAPPTLIDLGKVVSKLLNPGCSHVRVNPGAHPIRFGHEFCTLSSDQMRSVIYRFESDNRSDRRIVCLHDDILRKMFLDSITEVACVGSIYGTAECGMAAKETEYVPIDELEITPIKVGTASKKASIQIGDNGSVHITAPGDIVVNT